MNLGGANKNLENFVKFTFPEIFHNKEMLSGLHLMWDGAVSTSTPRKEISTNLNVITL